MHGLSCYIIGRTSREHNGYIHIDLGNACPAIWMSAQPNMYKNVGKEVMPPVTGWTGILDLQAADVQARVPCARTRPKKAHISISLDYVHRFRQYLHSDLALPKSMYKTCMARKGRTRSTGLNHAGAHPVCSHMAPEWRIRSI